MLINKNVKNRNSILNLISGAINIYLYPALLVFLVSSTAFVFIFNTQLDPENNEFTHRTFKDISFKQLSVLNLIENTNQSEQCLPYYPAKIDSKKFTNPRDNISTTSNRHAVFSDIFTLKQISPSTTFKTANLKILSFSPLRSPPFSS